MAAQTPYLLFLRLHGRDMTPTFVADTRPPSHEPAEGGTMPPPAWDPIRWAYAGERERKLMVRLGRGEARSIGAYA